MAFRHAKWAWFRFDLRSMRELSYKSSSYLPYSTKQLDINFTTRKTHLDHVIFAALLHLQEHGENLSP